MEDPDRLFFKESIGKELHEKYFDAVLAAIPDEVLGICVVDAIYLMGDDYAMIAVQLYDNLSERKSDPMRSPDLYLKIPKC